MVDVISGLALFALIVIVIWSLVKSGVIETGRKPKQPVAAEPELNPTTTEGKLLKKIADNQEQQANSQRMLVGALVGVLIIRVIYAFL